MPRFKNDLGPAILARIKVFVAFGHPVARKRHRLVIPAVRGQWSAVNQDHGLARAPILDIKFGLVGSDDLGHYGAPCLLYTSPSPRDGLLSRMPSSA